MLKIGLIDSGMGGFSILKALMKDKINAEYFYIYDNKHHPYGQKSQNELMAIGYQNMKTLLNYEENFAIIACNTLTSGCVDKLRGMFNVPIIGVEPPIKPCGKECKNILVLATPFTLMSERVQNLTHDYLECNFYYPSLPELATLIEAQIENEDIINAYLIEKLKNYKNIDGIVIGCTHYNFIEKNLKKIFPNAKIFSNIIGVCKRVQNIINDCNFNKSSYSSVKVFATGEELSVEKKYFLCKYIDFSIEFLSNL